MAPAGSTRASPKVLFISGSIGLGHVTRDLAIARALRQRVPDVELTWLAGDAARDAIAAAGEPLAPEAARYTTGAAMIEALSERFVLNLASPAYIFRLGSAFRRLSGFVRDVGTNVALFRDVAAREAPDLIVGDETFELVIARARNPRLKTAAPFVLITDFIGADAMSRNPFERLVVYLMNRGWAGLLTGTSPPADRVLFVGEEDDVPDTSFGFRLPNRRESARRAVQFLGYICPFDPADYADRQAVRTRLGYGSGPLVICAVGGTAVGAGLLQLCAKAYPLVSAKLTGVHFALVCGPRIAPATVDAPSGVDVRGYVDRLYEHFAACDLAVIQGGGTTTLELTALRRPFLYFPLEQHFEQQVHVAGRLARHGAGVKLEYGKTTPTSLAEVILANIGAAPSYPRIPTDGAARAAEQLCRLLPPGTSRA